jgi:hypothetical protein
MAPIGSIRNFVINVFAARHVSASRPRVSVSPTARTSPEKSGKVHVIPALAMPCKPLNPYSFAVSCSRIVAAYVANVTRQKTQQT